MLNPNMSMSACLLKYNGDSSKLCIIFRYEDKEINVIGFEVGAMY